jgi:glycerol-3-phosphate dehydrogenase
VKEAAIRRKLMPHIVDFINRKQAMDRLDSATADAWLRAALRMAPRVAGILAGELGKDEKWQAHQIEAFNQTASGYLVQT